MPSNNNILIIGAGLAGLSAAYHLKRDSIIFEKESRPGGMASSDTVNGFTFDKTGHLFHFQTKYVKGLLQILCNDGLKLIEHKRSSWIFSKGTYTRYPFQVNTYGLPPAIIKDCLIKIAETQTDFSKRKNGANFKNWILNNFGEGIARHFMFPYNRKLWKIPLHKMAVDWAEKFVPKTDIEQAIRGAVTDYKKNLGYSRVFYYPQAGGIQKIVDALYNHINSRASSGKRVRLGKEAVKINLRKKRVVFNDGKERKYQTLISTVPLPELANITEDLPVFFKDRLKRLAYVSIFNLNLGINRPKVSDKHWVYFPEGKYIFYRVGFFSNISEGLAPQGTSSIYTEVSYRDNKPFGYNKSQLEGRIINDLKKTGTLTGKDEIIARKSYDIRYSYPVHDKNRQSYVDDIKDFLKQHSIYSIGRYGSWRYMTMEECILEGKLTAEAVNSF